MTRHFRSFSRAAVTVVALTQLVACAPRHPLRHQLVYVDREPPAARVEVVTVRPGAEFAWVPGYWRWERNDYAWAPGHWERAPHGRAAWVAGRWRRDRRGWYFAPGHWR